MDFPFTFNGHTYEEADFQGNEYAPNLGPFLFDALRNCTANLFGSSDDGLTCSTGNRTLDVSPANLDFTPGMPIVLFQKVQGTGSSRLNVMFGFVQTYDGTTLEFRCTGTMGSSVGTKFGWNVAYAAGFRNLLYSNGSSSALGQRNVSGVMSPGKNPFMVEDFIGDRRPNHATTLQFNDRLYASCTGAGRLDFNELKSGGVSGARDDAVPDLGNHPGLVRMSVRAAGDVAAFCFQNYGTMCFGMYEYQRLQICFYMPHNVNGSSTDRFSLVMGLLNNANVVTDNQTDLKVPGFARIAPTILTPRYPGSTSGSYVWEVPAGTQTIDTQEGETLNPPGGAWYKLSIGLGEDFFPILRIESMDPARPYVRMVKWLDEYITTFAKSTATTPFVKLEKTSGNAERVIYVDYVALGAQIGSVDRT